jgi:hypothetical protein
MKLSYSQPVWQNTPIQSLTKLIHKGSLRYGSFVKIVNSITIPSLRISAHSIVISKTWSSLMYLMPYNLEFTNIFHAATPQCSPHKKLLQWSNRYRTLWSYTIPKTTTQCN